MENNKAKVRVRLEHKVEYENPIQVTAGETVQVGRADDDYPGWIWCRAVDSREGWMPCELLSIEGSIGIVLQDYSAKELAVQPGDELAVQEVRHGWMLVRNEQGELGWIPQSHVEM
jgi:SH3-like domain-containing protein